MEEPGSNQRQQQVQPQLQSPPTPQPSQQQQQPPLQQRPEDVCPLWDQLVHQWDAYKKRDPNHIRDQVRRGIPHPYRGIVWQYLCDAQAGITGPAAGVRARYIEYLKTPSPCEKMIKRDVARTFPEIEYFSSEKGAGQAGLYNVMKVRVRLGCSAWSGRA